jgi:hypothetical protein
VVVPFVERTRIARIHRRDRSIRRDDFNRRVDVTADMHCVIAFPQVDHDLINARRRFAKVIGKPKNPVRSGGADNKCVVAVRLAVQLHFRAVHDHRRKESAIFENFKILPRRFAGFVVLHVIRIGMRCGPLSPY